MAAFAEKIISHGQKPEYLDIFLGMTEHSDLMDARVASVETEIASYFTNREWFTFIFIQLPDYHELIFYSSFF